MVGRDITPTDMGKHANLIKAAQEEIATMDVLVCGRCLQVFHFIEEFRQHKSKPCEKETKNIRDSDDTKPKIWAFLLWKTTQMNKEAGPNYPSSWSFYQTWVKMDDNLRETWVVAGKTIHSFSRLGQGTLQEMPVKITKTVVNNTDPNSRRKGPSKVTEIEQDKSPVKTANKMQTFLRKTASPVKTSPTFSKPVSRRAKRTLNGTDEVVDDDVEKVVAKRFNPQRKSYEYLVKWDGRGHECNTWESAGNLETVPHMLEIFERQLARQKENRAMQAKQQATGGAKDDATKATGSSVGATGESHAASGSAPSGEVAKNTAAATTTDVSTRPVRVSKTKAMDQVKQWVAAGANDNITSPSSVSGSETVGNGSTANWSNAKRKLEATELNDTAGIDLPITTSTMEDLEEDLIPSHMVKRMKSGSNVVSVESKSPKMNGVVGGRATVSGESLPAGPNSADIILTQDTTATGVVKKPGSAGHNLNASKPEAQIRVLSRGESAVSNSGIVRVANTTENSGGLEIRSTTINRGPQLRSNTAATVGGTVVTPTGNSSITVTVGGANTVSSVLGRPTPTNIGNTQITTVQNRQTPAVSTVRPPLGTTIQRKTVTTLPTQPPQVQRTLPTQTRTTIQPAVGCGRMVVPRIGGPAMASTNQVTSHRTITKNVTPEQKILQLSKSGDLKVTKKVMTREDPIAQRLNQRQQQQLQQQSQVQIQKVQHVGASTRPTASVSIRKVADSTSQQEEAQSQLVAAKISAHDEQQAAQQILQQAGTLQSQLANQQEQLVNQQEQQLQEIDPTLLLTTDSQMLTNEDGTPLLVTGEDGTVYQVAGKNANGQTVLVTTGPDGEQQYAYVATADGDDQQMLALDNAVAEAVAQMPADQQNETVALPTSDGQYLVKTTQEDGTTQMLTMTEDELAQHQILAGVTQRQEQQQQQQTAGQLCIQTGDGDGQEGNIPAEVVQADLPSPGGTRRVVLLLQDGTFMMTEMHDDEYKSLNITA